MKLLKYLISGLCSIALSVIPTNIFNSDTNLLASAAAVVVPRVNIAPIRIDPFQEGRSYTITASIDEPIICPPSVPAADCHVVLYIDNPDPSLVSIDPCWERWDISDWHQTRTFKVSAIPHYYNIPQKEITIRPRVIKSGSEYYNGFQPPSIIFKTAPVRTATCSSTGDPHYTTFDGYYWHFYGRGKEWLVRTPSSSLLATPGTSAFAAQTITHGAGYSRNCALAILENGNYIMVSVCRGSFESVIRTLNLDTATHPKLLGGGSSYEIKFPSGVAAQFQTWGSNANVWITLPAGYYQSGISGLCGNWDGNLGNEGLSYVYNEWQDLPIRHRVMPGDLDLFSVSEAQIRASMLPPPPKQQSATCDYVPPKYIAPILNNPDVEDLTDLIKQAYSPPRREEDFLAGDGMDDPIIDISDDDMALADGGQKPDTPITNDEYNRLMALCGDFPKRPELGKCQALPIMKYVAACQNDLQFHPTDATVQENWLAASAECNTLIIQTQQPINTTQEAANQVIENLVVVLGRCYGVVCALGSTCSPSTGMCRCADARYRGPACDIPINAIPQLIGIRPKYLEFNRKPTDPEPVVMYIPHTAFIKDLAPEDNMVAVVDVDDGTGIARKPISKNCTFIGNGQVSCPVSVLITDQQLRNTIILTWSYSVILAQQQLVSVMSPVRVVVPNKFDAQQIIYTNPCIQCAANPTARIGEQETCFREADMCFPGGFRRLEPLAIRDFFGQTCTKVGQSPTPDINPCLVCSKDDQVFVNWLSQITECQPRLVQPHLETRIIEPTTTGKISAAFDISPYLKLTSAFPENLIISPPDFRFQTGIITTSQGINPTSVISKLSINTNSTVSSLYILELRADLIQPFSEDGLIIATILVYSNYSIPPIDMLKILIRVINNLDNDPTTSTTTSKPTTTIILTTSSGTDTKTQPSTASQELTSTTTNKPQIVCPIMSCEDGCYAERSTFSGCIIACFCRQTRPTPNETITTDLPTTIEESEDQSPDSSSPKTLPPGDDIPRTTIKPIVVSSTANNPNKVSVGGLIGIVVAAMFILVVMLLAGYRYRYSPLKDVAPENFINSDNDNQNNDMLGKIAQHNNPLYYRGEISARELGMKSNPIYAATQPITIQGRKDDIFNNPTYSVHTNPLFVETNESLINPLYEALYTFEEGTYKFVGSSDNMRLFVKEPVGVVIYDVAYNYDANTYSLCSGTSNPIYFSSVMDLSNYYADPGTLDISPLNSRLSRPLPSGTYNSGELYIFNNANIKNVAVA